MKHILLAVAIAFGSISAPVAVQQASAASVIISENGVTVRDRDRRDYRHHRRHYREHHCDRDWRNGRRAYREHCRVWTVKKYLHHRVVYKKVRVCR